jgi:hypothetical protein
VLHRRTKRDDDESTQPPLLQSSSFSPRPPLSPTSSPARHDDRGDGDATISPPLRPSTSMMHAGVVLDNDDDDDEG